MGNMIGEKSNFGIEYEIQSIDYYVGTSDPYVLGHMRVWIEGKYIGAYEDVDMLGVAWWALEVEGNMKESQLSNKTADDIYDLMITEGIPDVSHCHLGPPFDDFVTLSYVCNGKIHFIWKLVDEPCFQYPDYPKGVQSAEVSVEEYRRVVSEFGKIVEDARKQGEQR